MNYIDDNNQLLIEESKTDVTVKEDIETQKDDIKNSDLDLENSVVQAPDETRTERQSQDGDGRQSIIEDQETKIFKDDPSDLEKSTTDLMEETERSIAEQLIHSIREAHHYLHPVPKHLICQKKILSLLDQDKLSVHELSEKVSEPQHLIVKMTGDLLHHGFITEEEEDTKTVFSITDSGKEHLNFLSKECTEPEELLDILNEDQQQELVELMNILLKNWKETGKGHLPHPPKPPIHKIKNIHPVKPALVS